MNTTGIKTMQPLSTIIENIRVGLIHTIACTQIKLLLECKTFLQAIEHINSNNLGKKKTKSILIGPKKNNLLSVRSAKSGKF